MNVIHDDDGDEMDARPKRRREARAEAILDAAMAVLDRDGIEALTLARVGAEIDVGAAALYRYFASKDALLAALQRRTIAAIHARLREHTAALAAQHPRLEPGPRALLVVVSLAGFYATAARAMPQAFRLVQALLADPRPVIADDAAQASVPLLTALLLEVGALYDAAVAARALPAGDTFERTLITWAALHGITSLHKLARFEKRFAEGASLGEAALTALLIGFGAEPDALRRATRALARTP